MTSVIEANQIKYERITATTTADGYITLGTKRIISVTVVNYHMGFLIRSTNGATYYLRLYDPDTLQPVGNTQVTLDYYYISE